MKKAFLFLFCLSAMASLYGMQKFATIDELDKKMDVIEETSKRVKQNVRDLNNIFHKTFTEERERLVRRFNNPETPEEYKKELLKEIEGCTKMLKKLE